MQNRMMSTIASAALLLAPAAWANPDDHRFLDREALVETLTVEDEAVLEIAETELEAEEVVLAGLAEILEDAKTEFDAAEMELDEAAKALDLAKDAVEMKGMELLDALMALQNAIDMGSPAEEIERLAMAAADAADAVEIANGEEMKAQAHFDMAEMDFGEKKDAFEMAEANVDDQIEIVETAEMVVAEIEEEIERTETFVEELSDAQVFAFRRNFNSAINSGLLPLLITADDLEGLGLDANKLQINAFARSFMHRSRFEGHAARFDADGDLAKAEWFRGKGERMFQKFDSKIDRFAGQFDASDGLDEAVVAEAKGAAKAAAKAGAKNAARTAAQGEAKKAAKAAVQGEAKSAAKAAAKEEGKKAAQGVAKGHSS